MPSRIFIGIPIAKDLQKQVRKLDVLALDSPQSRALRLIEPKNLHITLVPPWAENDLSDIASRLSSVVAESFDVTFDSITLGPTLKKPSLIWAQGQTPNGLVVLKQKISQVLTAHNDDQRFFKLHMTLARFKRQEFQQLQLQNLPQAVNWPMRAESFVLYESLPSKGGADYQILQEFPLN